MTSIVMLRREWVELREECTKGRIVLRPITYKVPPARGRRRLDLSVKGFAAAKSEGPSDKLQARGGSWSLQDDDLKVDAPGWTGTYRVEEITQEILVLRPK